MLASRQEESLETRKDAGNRFFEVEAERIARLCHEMAERFARGGRLIAVGLSPSARSDARHVAVEFVHPVIVGKRALPAVALTGGSGRVSSRVDGLVRPDDLVIGFGTEGGEGAEEVGTALATANRHGCLTVAFGGADSEWPFAPPTDDSFVRQELIETLYHVLWELVHVFFEHRGLLGGGAGRRVEDGASDFLYPFLGEREHDVEGVLADVAGSVRMKAREAHDLRVATVREGWKSLTHAAGVLRAAFERGGSLLVFGNGGSATDAMDVAADFHAAPQGWPSRRTLDLTEDPAILTAIANDIGPEALFSRQIIAHGAVGDVALAISTSGSSRNIIHALEEARERGLATIALVGYDGGRILAEGLADHVIVTRSEHIPRIQEAQATAYHLLRELVER